MGLNEKVLFYNDERRMKETVTICVKIYIHNTLRVFHYFWVSHDSKILIMCRTIETDQTSLMRKLISPDAVTPLKNI